MRITDIVCLILIIIVVILCKYFWSCVKKSLKKSREKKEAERIARKQHHNETQSRFVKKFLDTKTKTETNIKIAAIPVLERKAEQKDANGKDITQVKEPYEETEEHPVKKNDDNSFPNLEIFTGKAHEPSKKTDTKSS